MCGKSNIETHITIPKIDSQREFALWFCINLEGRNGE